MLAPSAVHHLSHSSVTARSRVAMRFFLQTVYCWGSQCFLSVSALTGMLCPLRWACLRACLRPCLPSGLGCCVRLAGLVFLLSPVLSAILAGMLCPPRWAVSGLVSQLVSHLVWDALSASLVLSLVLSPQLLSLFCLVACLSFGMLCLPPLGLSFSCLWSCLPACLLSGLGCCVRLLGSSPSPACLRSFVSSCFPVGLVCPCSGLVSKISCEICATVWGLRWCNLLLFIFVLIPESVAQGFFQRTCS